MSSEMTVDTRDLVRLAARSAAAAHAVHDELAVAMTRSTIMVEGDARILAPVDTGLLRRSITHEVQRTGEGVVGKVGTNVPYGRYVEEGTRPHFPPVAAVAGWAGRHGIEPYLVARAIARHGTRARPYLKPALAKNLAAINDEFRRAATRILARFGGRA